MASQFQEERFFLGEKSNEKKPGKNGITLELEEFDAMVRLIP